MGRPRLAPSSSTVIGLRTTMSASRITTYSAVGRAWSSQWMIDAGLLYAE